jgi:CheY-like chemotaxis protein
MKREPSGVVLYVEDNRVNFLLVEQLLSIWSLIELHCAENGARALELARVVVPDLVILDVHLPDISGLEVLRRLKREPALARTRMAVLSASAMPGDVAKAREAGVVDYWTKPLDVARFLKDVQRLLGP